MKALHDHRYPAPASAAILFILAAIIFCGCSQSHVLHQKADGTRDFIYIDFQRNHKPFEIQETLQPGHAAHIKVIGFEGNKILVEFDAPKENCTLDITGRGFDLRQCGDQLKTIMVRDPESIISICVSALSESEYILKLTRL